MVRNVRVKKRYGDRDLSLPIAFRFTNSVSGIHMALETFRLPVAGRTDLTNKRNILTSMNSEDVAAEAGVVLELLVALLASMSLDSHVSCFDVSTQSFASIKLQRANVALEV